MTRIFILLTLALPLFAQNYKPTSQTNPNLNLDSVLAGVKVVRVGFETELQKEIDNGEFEDLEESIKEYLNYLGFNRIAVTTKDKADLDRFFNSYCDEINFYCWWQNDGTNLKLAILFRTCTRDNFIFEISYPVQSNEIYNGFADYMLKEWKQLYTRKKIYYNVNQRLSLPKLPTNWTEKSVMRYLDSADIDLIEGIYEIIKDGSEKRAGNVKYKIAVIKSDKTTYNVIYLSGASNSEDWAEGEIKAVLRKTAIPGNYKVQWYMANKFLDEDIHMDHDPKGILMFKIGTPPETNRYIKLYPIKW